MLRYEWKKLLTSRMCLLLTVIVLVACFFVSYAEVEYNREDALTRQFYDYYMIHTEEVERQKAIFEQSRDAYWDSFQPSYGQGENTERPVWTYENVYAEQFGVASDEDLFVLLDMVNGQAETYEKACHSVIKRAETNLKIYESRGEIGYSVDYQKQVIELYQRLSAEPLTATPVGGWETYFTSSYEGIFIFVLCFLMASELFLYDRKHQMTAILHTTKRGRGYLVANKIMVLGISSGAAVLAVSLVSLGGMMLKTPFFGMGAEMQCMESFRLCPLRLTVAEYLLISKAIQWLAAYAFSLICSLCVMLTSHALLGGGLSVLLLWSQHAANTAVWQDPNHILAHANLFAVSDTGSLFSRYGAVSFMGYAWNRLIVILFVYAVICGGSIALTFLCYRTMAYRRVLRLRDDLGRIFEKRRKSPKRAIRVKARTLLGYELHKCCQNVPIVILALLLIVGGTVTVILPVQTASRVDERLYRSYMTELSGPYSEEKVNYIKNIQADIQAAVEEYEALQDLIHYHEPLPPDYREIMARYEDAMTKQASLERVSEAIKYASHMSAVPGEEETETGGEETAPLDAPESTNPEIREQRKISLLYDSGWNALLATEGWLFLWLSMALLLAGLMADEYTVGMAPILRSSKNGRMLTWRAKMKVAIGFAGSAYLVLTVAQLLAILMAFGLPELDAPAYSLELLSMVTIPIPLWVYAVLTLLTRLIGILLAVCLTVGISCLVKDRMTAFFTVALVGLVPAICDRIGISAIRSLGWWQICDGSRIWAMLLSTDFIEGILCLASFILITVCVYIYGRRKFTNT